MARCIVNRIIWFQFDLCAVFLSLAFLGANLPPLRDSWKYTSARKTLLATSLSDLWPSLFIFGGNEQYIQRLVLRHFNFFFEYYHNNLDIKYINTIMNVERTKMPKNNTNASADKSTNPTPE